MERKVFLVCSVLGLVFLTLYLTKLEERVQKNLEEKVSVIQSLHERNVGMVKKEFNYKFDSLNTDLSNKLLILEVDREESCSFIWKITSFKNKLRQGKNNERKCIKSVPFYAYGYKLMLKLYPNGYGIGVNSHLSIVNEHSSLSFVNVRKGEYDGMLPRVFSKQVTFTLIDQQDNRNRRRLNVAKGFTADFEKPTENRTSSEWGLIKFVSHDDFSERRFVVNDTLFIKVQVDSPRVT
ncbi:TNF receptor-associated factor 4-like [Orbicella faveolata]|uniref:TNF receptor-associated factor 4-like n=1 Tax=Orbicella faveolata TaxID=48498 RepID=UPI0009E216A1|nr:TNF receptor-associated factor 4-like [Orbicella faveolata]